MTAFSCFKSHMIGLRSFQNGLYLPSRETQNLVWNGTKVVEECRVVS